LTYCYIYTGERKKEERILRIENALANLSEKEDIIFIVNDLQSIAYLKEKGYKAMNVDALEDLFNLSDGSDTFYVSTPEDITYLKASFANIKEI